MIDINECIDDAEMHHSPKLCVPETNQVGK